MLTSNFKKSGVDETIGLAGLEVTWVGAVGGSLPWDTPSKSLWGPLPRQEV